MKLGDQTVDGGDRGAIAAGSYRCAACGGVFEKGWSDAEATAEREANFPGLEAEDCAVICDDCYQELLAVVAGAAQP